jgi:hypothetical protein
METRAQAETQDRQRGLSGVGGWREGDGDGVRKIKSAALQVSFEAIALPLPTTGQSKANRDLHKLYKVHCVWLCRRDADAYTWVVSEIIWLG